MSDVTLTGLCAWHEADGQESHTVINYNGSGNKLVTTTDPAGIQVLTSTEHGFQTNLQRKGPSDEPAGATATVYDEHGRVAQTVLDFEDNRPDAVTDYTYDALDRVLSQTEPEPNAASPYFGRRVTSTTYDNLGRVIVVESGTQTTTTSYLPTGEVSEVSGSTNPVRYQYDDLGRLWKLKTYKDASGSPWTGEAITTWNYSATRGTLTSKSYNSGGGPAYLYTDAGRVSRKTNQRNIQANYTFNDFGEVSFINYSDTTQDVTLTYDRLGRLKTVKDAAGLRTFTYDNAGRMLTESIASATGAGNLLSGVTVTNAYDTTTKLRTAHTTAKSTLSKTVDYGYDSWRRMDHVQKGTLHARFAYDDVTGQIVSTTYIHNDDDPTGNPHVLGERTHDQLGRLSLLEWTSANTSGAGDIAGFGYEHDADGRRIRMDLTADETYWEYGYDDLGQLASAEHIKDDGQAAVVIPGESSQYIYDDIGNRLAVYEGGGDGQNPYLATYTSNLLNQYTGRDVPGNVEVVGRTSLSTVEDVFVNTEEAWRNGCIFAKRITFNNADDPVVGEIAVEEFAAGPVHIRTSWWDVFLPEDPESFTYDADGNLTLDGVWHYEWDAENRLKSMQMRDEVAAVLLAGNNTWSRLDFAYDWMGRRISKQYSTSTSDPATSGGKYGPPILWSIDKVFRYVYDGWHLSMSYRADGLSGCDPDQSFAWGPDLSGGYGGAGGIGGLVAYTDDEHDALNPAPSDPDFLGPMFPIYDGNGNIVKMIRFEDLGSSTFEAREAAAYEYGPFGENRSTTGEFGAPAQGGTHQGQRNPFRFSTKYTDAETGLVYYGYRYYSPSMGRWVSRDPIAEAGGRHLLSFVSNQPISSVDALGLWERNHDWKMNKPGSYVGTAVSECGDDLGELAYLITGDSTDAALLSSVERIRDFGNSKVDVSPLLAVLERRLRSSVVRATSKWGGHFGNKNGNEKHFRARHIERFFQSGSLAVTDCWNGARLILAKGLIDHVGEGPFDELFAPLASLPLKHSNSGINETLAGDWMLFYNAPIYSAYSRRVRGRLGDLTGENVIKIGSDAYWGLDNPPSVRTYEGWRLHFKEVTNELARALGEPEILLKDVPRHDASTVQFLDVVEIGQKMFEYRKKSLAK